MDPITVSVNPKIAGPLRYPHFVWACSPRPSQRFTAYVTSDPVNNGVRWSVEQGGGQIDEIGVFVPPEHPGKTTIRATSVTDPSKYDDATITYEYPGR